VCAALLQRKRMYSFPSRSLCLFFIHSSSFFAQRSLSLLRLLNKEKGIWDFTDSKIQKRCFQAFSEIFWDLKSKKIRFFPLSSSSIAITI
jgi:hypothetical protein